ncbi:hypothetical protein OXPF_14770 [Oxobacter pfennigii]|uniref:DUF1540 domain-containing protein n=1 Tax=Oxobacter pfennigii TaxID=36849 RepID=A0A0P8WR18_9CLOT|nr:DUF1540 domain-containing protein [Oxobacter pfennigii]KPU44999.1 hypothetical protein OXPF_14770 [Oxobacter pfennigii]
MGNKSDKDKPIGRVKCVVDSCVHNGNDNHCMASSIEIEANNPSSAEITDCATFEPRGIS